MNCNGKHAANMRCAVLMSVVLDSACQLQTNMPGQVTRGCFSVSSLCMPYVARMLFWLCCVICVRCTPHFSVCCTRVSLSLSLSLCLCVCVWVCGCFLAQLAVHNVLYVGKAESRVFKHLPYCLHTAARSCACIAYTYTACAPRRQCRVDCCTLRTVSRHTMHAPETQTHT